MKKMSDKIKQDKHLLNLEIIIIILDLILLFSLVYLISYIEINILYRNLIICMGFIIFIIGILYCIKIEQAIGYYKCNKCNHKYVPTFISVLLAMHFGRTRYLKCPKCGKYSWNKKVIEK